MKQKAIGAKNTAAIKDFTESPKKKKKNQMQMLVRKHFMQKKKGLDMQFLTRVVNMQDKLETIFQD